MCPSVQKTPSILSPSSYRFYSENPPKFLSPMADYSPLSIEEIDYALKRNEEIRREQNGDLPLQSSMSSQPSLLDELDELAFQSLQTYFSFVDLNFDDELESTILSDSTDEESIYTKHSTDSIRDDNIYNFFLLNEIEDDPENFVDFMITYHKKHKRDLKMVIEKGLLPGHLFQDYLEEKEDLKTRETRIVSKVIGEPKKHKKVPKNKNIYNSIKEQKTDFIQEPPNKYVMEILERFQLPVYIDNEDVSVAKREKQKSKTNLPKIIDSTKTTKQVKDFNISKEIPLSVNVTGSTRSSKSLEVFDAINPQKSKESDISLAEEISHTKIRRNNNASNKIGTLKVDSDSERSDLSKFKRFKAKIRAKKDKLKIKFKKLFHKDFNPKQQ